uniref:Uncharacterized protein n=1 Tax=Naja naja TaxID=35670 RepID=A0A8C6Y4U2_NAJNA
MDEDLDKEIVAYSLQNSSEALLSIQLLDFKTTFLEAVEELRMKRVGAFIIYEAVQHEKEALKKQHAEAITTLKKQVRYFFPQNISLKGKHLLAVESKEREVEGLKETFKNLQCRPFMMGVVNNLILPVK